MKLSHVFLVTGLAICAFSQLYASLVPRASAFTRAVWLLLDGKVENENPDSVKRFMMLVGGLIALFMAMLLGYKAYTTGTVTR